MHRPVTQLLLPCPTHSYVARIGRALPLFALAIVVLPFTPLRAQDRAPVHKVAPVYPALAKQMGITGVVVVTTTVDPSGKVVKAESTSGNKLLTPSAIDAVKQWKFAPGEGTDTFPVRVSFEKG